MTRTDEELASLSMRAAGARELACRRQWLVREALARARLAGDRFEACRLTVEAARWRRTIESGRVLQGCHADRNPLRPLDPVRRRPSVPRR